MTDKRDIKIIEWNDEEPYREPVDETKPFDVRYGKTPKEYMAQPFEADAQTE